MFKNKLFVGVGALSMVGATLVASEPVQVVDATIQERLEKIDPLMNRALETLKIPGMAIGVVVDGKVVFTKGYGIRDFSDPLPVTENTLFAIGSCSKAFTTFALGQLVDEGMLAWDDPVIKYLPEFRLKDIHATHHLTIRDLVTHRSGLPRHDLAWYNSTFPRKEILDRLPHFEPTCDLREKFQYNNFMYGVAGLVIERVSGKTWEEFVQGRIFMPLGMKNSNFSVAISQQADDFASPHTEKNEKVEVIPFRNLSNIGPAGSINSTIEDMMKWVELQLSDGKQLIQKETLKDMHLVHMPMHSPILEDAFGYGLGWFTALHEGHYIVAHGGGIDGFISMVTLYPKQKLGVVVLTNSDSHGLFPTMAAYGIADLLLGKEDDLWLSKVEEKEKQMKELMKQSADVAEVISEAALLHSPNQYIGEFEHLGYGSIKIDLNQGVLVASHNNIRYSISPTGYDHFNLSMESREESQKMGGAFVSNRSGDISELHVSFEAQLAPIVFKRKVSNELIATDYLKKFIGVFECSLFSMEVTLKGGHLTATVPGQPSCVMKPEKKNLFSIKEVPGCSLQFVVEADQLVSELQLHQAGQTFSLKAKAAD